MSLYTIDEFFNGVKEQCSLREFIPMLFSVEDQSAKLEDSFSVFKKIENDYANK